MDTKELRYNFQAHLQNVFPNDNNIGSTVSTAFFLERYGHEFGVDFQQVLTTRKIPPLYKQKLETYFATRGRKNPQGDASVYERALRLLLEYLSGNPWRGKEQSTKDGKLISAEGKTESIPRPADKSVRKYLEKWRHLPGYPQQEAALSLLFHNTYPANDNLSEVLIKCAALNDFYGTNIFGVYPIAQHIVSLRMDARLADGDPTLVHAIARGHGITAKSGKERYLFSFATKYCSHHNAIDFPIYDSYVAKLLIHFRNADRFSVFRDDELRDYTIFKKVILDFRKVYFLQEFSLKQIDQYLWQLGKESFPKQYANPGKRSVV